MTTSGCSVTCCHVKCSTTHPRLVSVLFGRRRATTLGDSSATYSCRLRWRLAPRDKRDRPAQRTCRGHGSHAASRAEGGPHSLTISRGEAQAGFPRASPVHSHGRNVVERCRLAPVERPPPMDDHFRRPHAVGRRDLDYVFVESVKLPLRRRRSVRCRAPGAGPDAGREKRLMPRGIRAGDGVNAGSALHVRRRGVIRSSGASSRLPRLGRD